MTFGSLLLANLLRHRVRTALTFVSLVVAFLLLVLLRAIAAVFSAEADAHDPRLVVMAKFRSAYMLPVSQVEEIRRLPHVSAASPMVQLLAHFRDATNTFDQLGVEPAAYLRINDDIVIDPAAVDRLTSTRTGAVISVALAEKFGWQAGDRIALESTAYPTEAGSRVWEFDIVGTFTQPGRVPELMLFNYDYYAEATVFNKNVVGLITARVADPNRVVDAIEAVDALFANSPHPTSTVTRDYLERNFGRRLGDIGTITSFVIAAVFFTVLLVTGNTLAQSIRERRTELAVMKSLGFRGRALAGMVLAETLLLSLAAAVVGAVLALLLQPMFNQSLSEYVGTFHVTWRTLALTAAVAVVSGLVIGLTPAWVAGRADIARSLRRA